jgi:hypothetical protein
MISEELTQQLSDSNWQVRKKAVEELGKQTDDNSEAALIKALSDDRAEVWRAAEKSLGRITSTETARRLAYFARSKKANESKRFMTVTLPFTSTATAFTPQGTVSTGSFSFQMPKLCVYCGIPVGQYEKIRAKLPASSGRATIKQRAFDAPCCVKHQAEARRNEQINSTIFFVGLIIGFIITLYVVPIIFAETTTAGRFIYGLITFALGTTLLIGVMQGAIAKILSRISPAFASLLASPNYLDEGCMGLIVRSGGNETLNFSFTNPECGAQFYVINPKTVIEM